MVRVGGADGLGYGDLQSCVGNCWPFCRRRIRGSVMVLCLSRSLWLSDCLVLLSRSPLSLVPSAPLSVTIACNLCAQQPYDVVPQCRNSRFSMVEVKLRSSVALVPATIASALRELQ